MAVRAGLPFEALGLAHGDAGVVARAVAAVAIRATQAVGDMDVVLMSVEGPCVPSSMAEWQVMQESAADADGTPPASQFWVTSNESACHPLPSLLEPQRRGTIRVRRDSCMTATPPWRKARTVPPRSSGTTSIIAHA